MVALTNPRFRNRPDNPITELIIYQKFSSQEYQFYEARVESFRDMYRSAFSMLEGCGVLTYSTIHVQHRIPSPQIHLIQPNFVCSTSPQVILLEPPGVCAAGGMIPSTMDVTLHCDDDVCIEINISNLTKAEEIIHQVISLRRSMSPSLDLDFQECILCLEIGTSRRILSRESILLSLLIAPGKKSLQQAYRITASGFRMKTAVLLRSINDQRYLIERKTLELRYLTASAGSRLPSDLAPPLQITNYETDTVHDTNTSSSSKSCSDSRLHGSNLSRCILQKYEEFVNEVREILAHRRTSTEGSLAGTKTLQLNKAEGF